jgi:hypothetical protein
MNGTDLKRQAPLFSMSRARVTVRRARISLVPAHRRAVARSWRSSSTSMPEPHAYHSTALATFVVYAPPTRESGGSGRSVEV